MTAGQEQFSLWTDFISACGGVLALLVACWQLPGISKSTKSSAESAKSSADSAKFAAIQIVLTVEETLRSNENDMVRTANKFSETLSDGDESEYDQAQEHYFNTLDRLCYLIHKMDRETFDWKNEYRPMLIKTIGQYPHLVEAASPYKNIIAVQRDWQIPFHIGTNP